MKRFELIFTFIQLPVDYLMLVLAGIVAYALRFSNVATNIRPVLFATQLSWSRYWPIVLTVALGWIVIFVLSGLYSANPNRKFSRDIARIIMGCSTGFAAITIYVFFTLSKFDSRFLVLTSWILSILFVTLGRLILRGAKGLCYRFGVGLRRTVIIGSEAIADTINQALSKQPRLGYKIVGEFEKFTPKQVDIIKNLKIDEIIFTNPKANEGEALRAIDFANENHLVFKYSADLFSTITTNMEVSAVAGVPIIELKRTRLTGWGRINKRLFDLVAASGLIILCLPMYLLVAVAIFLETGWPIIYKNERVGQFGKRFFALKFRTMFQRDSTGIQFGDSGEAALKREAELIKTNNIKDGGPIYKIKNDPRITPLGKFLRAWSLDELPQFWNVLKGEMSLVGPRPHQLREVAGYEKDHKIVFAIKPGITGLAQISGRSNLSFEEEIKLDAFYIENWNMYLDLIIIIKTPFIILKKTGSIV